MKNSFTKNCAGLLAMFVFLLSMATIAPAFTQQPITLDEAVQMALENSPRLKSAETSIEAIHARGARRIVGIRRYGGGLFVGATQQS